MVSYRFGGCRKGGSSLGSLYLLIELIQKKKKKGKRKEGRKPRKEGMIEESDREGDGYLKEKKLVAKLCISKLATYTKGNDKKNPFYKCSGEELSERSSSNHQRLFSPYSHKTGCEEECKY